MNCEAIQLRRAFRGSAASGERSASPVHALSERSRRVAVGNPRGVVSVAVGRVWPGCSLGRVSHLLRRAVWLGALVVAVGSLSAKSAPVSQGGVSGLPMAARGPVSAALGADDRAYRVVGWVARNRAQRLSARFGRQGVVISSGSARFGMKLAGFGRVGTVRELAVVAPRRTGANRVVYRRGVVDEWWANGPLGLEQGFDVGHRPAGSGSLTFALGLTGGFRVYRDVLLLPGGLRYAGLEASDARGRGLRAWLQTRGGRVLVHVDDRGARYPLRVDPLIQQAELTASAEGGGDLGVSVAVSGDTIVAGADLAQVGSNGSRARYLCSQSRPVAGRMRPRPPS